MHFNRAGRYVVERCTLTVPVVTAWRGALLSRCRSLRDPGLLCPRTGWTRRYEGCRSLRRHACPLSALGPSRPFVPLLAAAALLQRKVLFDISDAHADAWVPHRAQGVQAPKHNYHDRC